MDTMIPFPPCLSPADPAGTRAAIDQLLALQRAENPGLEDLGRVIQALGRLHVADLVALSREPGGSVAFLNLMSAASAFAGELAGLAADCTAAMDRAGVAAVARLDPVAFERWLEA